MRNCLFATASLAFVSSPVMAADKLSVGVGGYMQQWFGVANRDDDGADGGWASQSDSEVHFKGSLESDMGLKFSVHVELEGDRGANAIDESFARVSGEFGQVEFGARDHAMVRMHYGISDVGIGLTAGDTQKWIPGAYLDTYGHAIGNARKLNYISPRVSGLQVGVSYAPDDGAQDANTGAPSDNDDAGWGAALNFQQEVGDMAVTLSLGHRSAEQTGEQMVDTSGRNHLCSLTNANQEGGSGRYTALANTACDQMTVGTSLESGTEIVEDVATQVHFIPDTTKMTKADAGTYTNAGVGIGFGAFKFNVAYATADGGAYRVERTPIMYAVVDETPANDQGPADAATSAAALTTALGVTDREAYRKGTTDIPDNAHFVTGSRFNWGADGKMGGTGANADAPATRLVPEHTEAVVTDKSKNYAVWGASITYTEGAMALSLGHMMHENDDGGERTATMLSASYTMAPGVAWKTSVFGVEDTTEKGGEGTGFVTGIALSF